MADIRREMEGFRWYGLLEPGAPVARIVRDEPTYLVVRYPAVPGKTPSYRDGYWRNRRHVELVVEHYCDVWARQGLPLDVPWALHGDLSLDNVIFDGDRALILDWEHFAPAAAPAGFDALYLIFELIWVESRNQRPSGRVLAHAAEMVARLRVRGCLAPAFAEGPLGVTLTFLREHRALWGPQVERFERKLPIVQFDEPVRRWIDANLTI